MPTPVGKLTPITFDEPMPIAEVSAQEQEGGLSYLGKKFTKGIVEQVGRNLETGAAIGAGESPFVAGLRTILPREWVDKISEKVGPRPELSIIPGIGPALDITQKILAKKPGVKDYVNAESGFSPEALVDKFVGEIKPTNNAVVKTVGAGVEALGNAIGNPMGAGRSLARFISTATGAGIGGDLGGEAGASVARAAGGNEDVGRVIGSVVGGMGGAQASQIRLNAIKTIADPIADAGKAAFAARKAQKAGDERALLDIMGDNYSSLRSDAKGLIQNHVNSQVASALAKNADTPEKLAEAEKLAKTLGIDLNKSKYDLAQTTADPGLILMTQTQKPRTLEEAQGFRAIDQAQKRELIGKFKSITGETATPKTAEAGLEEFRQASVIRQNAVDALAQQELGKLQKFDPSQKFDKGEELKALFDAEKSAAKPIVNQKYEAAFAVDDAPKITLSPTQQAWAREFSDGMTQDQVRKAGLSFEGPVRLRDVESLLADVNKAQSVAQTAGDAKELLRLRNLKGELESTVSTQAAPEAVKKLAEARQYWNENYRPRFKEGENFNLDRNASRARSGEDYVRSEQAFEKYINGSETAMRQFDTLFGGGIDAPKNPQAYKLLGDAMQDKYRRAVEKAKTPEAFQAAHESFTESYKPQLDRVPQTASYFDEKATKIVKMLNDSLAEEQRYKTIAGSPLSQAVGPDQAAKMISGALTDPRKMNQIINAVGGNTATPHRATKLQPIIDDVMERLNIIQDGKFDGARMRDVLEKSRPGLKTLFEARYGKEIAAQHIERLNAIAKLAERQSIAELRELPPTQRLSSDITKDISGSSGASWIAYVKNASEGRAGSGYIAGIAGSRFFNQKLQAAMQDAERKALNDPEMSKAILEMYTKSAKDPLSSQAANKVFLGAGNTGKEFIAKLVDAGYINSNLRQGARLGLTQGSQKTEEETP
jgi:hypothetical protein